MAALPVRLAVYGDFTLADCIALASLPMEYFRVEGTLDFRGSLAWDGRVPECAEIHRIVTDLHPGKGMDLDEWNALHPDGELKARRT